MAAIFPKVTTTMKFDNPAFDYNNRKHYYAKVRATEPRIQQYIDDALTDAQTVINIGAGTGSYEPAGKYVISIEPSEKMRRTRIELGRNPAINATAQHLPFDDNSFDAALAILTIHHWPDLEAGLKEVRRVAKKKIVILTYDPEKLGIFWNIEYFPEVVEVERRRYPALDRVQQAVGCSAQIRNILIPLDCKDGFQEAFYGRPEQFLDEEIRRSQSAWSFIEPSLESQYVETLRQSLESGEWDKKYGHYRKLAEFEGAYRMLEFDLALPN